jgi:hypothetical protein
MNDRAIKLNNQFRLIPVCMSFYNASEKCLRHSMEKFPVLCSNLTYICIAFGVVTALAKAPTRYSIKGLFLSAALQLPHGSVTVSGVSGVLRSGRQESQPLSEAQATIINSTLAYGPRLKNS